VPSPQSGISVPVHLVPRRDRPRPAEKKRKRKEGEKKGGKKKKEKHAAHLHRVRAEVGGARRPSRVQKLGEKGTKKREEKKKKKRRENVG